MHGCHKEKNLVKILICLNIPPLYKPRSSPLPSAYVWKQISHHLIDQNAIEILSIFSKGPLMDCRIHPGKEQKEEQKRKKKEAWGQEYSRRFESSKRNKNASGIKFEGREKTNGFTA